MALAYRPVRPLSARHPIPQSPFHPLITKCCRDRPRIDVAGPDRSYPPSSVDERSLEIRLRPNCDSAAASLGNNAPVRLNGTYPSRTENLRPQSIIS